VSSRAGEPLVEPSLYLSLLVKEIGIRKLNRQGFGRRILEKISRRKLVKASTLQDYASRRLWHSTGLNRKAHQLEVHQSESVLGGRLMMQ
jgi:hypothetical protein